LSIHRVDSRNRSAELATTVIRLLNTTDCPIIVVDNDSEDDSAAVMRRCLKATGALLWAAMRDLEHTRGVAQALVRLPVVMTERQPLPGNVEQALTLLEEG
jgi:hypothetical protein